MLKFVGALGLAAMALAGCATRGAPTAAPSLVPAPSVPAPASARLYADCIAQSVASNTYDREQTRIRFHCEGQPAAMLNAALATWASRGGATHVVNGTRFNLSTPIERDLYGVDYCTSAAHNGDGPRCTIALNVGEILDAP